MLSIKLKFRPSLVEGKVGTLYYQVIYMRKVRHVMTDFKIMKNEWNPDVGELSTERAAPSRISLLNHIQRKVEYDINCFKLIEKCVKEMESPLSFDAIMEEFKRQRTDITLFSYTNNLIEILKVRGQFRTSETYQATLNSFRKFMGGLDVSLSDVDAELLISYECYLKSRGLSMNTISFYMRKLRAVYNNAVEKGCVNDKKPFRKVFTSTEKTAKRAIKLAHIRKLKEMDLSDSLSKSFARDMFLFSFYTRGMSFIDIAYLQKRNLRDDVLTYRRKKTGQLLSVHWEPCMQKIVDRYSSASSPFLLSVIKDYGADIRKQYHSILTLINRNLKAIGHTLELELPLTMYVARHSWASIARDEGIPLSVISEGMGHESENTTRIYLAQLETRIVDNANKRILKLI